MRSMSYRFMAALFALASLPAVARSQAVAPIKALVMTASNLQGGDERHRNLAARQGGLAPSMPGDTVRYRLTFTNIRPDSVHNVQFDDPLPSALRYVAGSARADREDVAITFSIDDGKTYSAQPMIDEKVDGRSERKPAPATMYTHVRWTVRGWVHARAQVTAEFNAHLSPDQRIKP